MLTFPDVEHMVTILYAWVRLTRALKHATTILKHITSISLLIFERT